MVTVKRYESSVERWARQQREQYGVYENRALAITPRGRKAIACCDGRWPEPCRDAWPVSRFAWCESCRGGAR